MFVDDIMHPTSNVENINSAIRKCRNLELTKGFTFSNKIEKTGVLVISNTCRSKKKEVEIKSQVGLGKISQVENYKYLGQWYNSQGNHECHIEKINEKVRFFITELKRYGNPYQVGKLAIEIRIKLYKTVVFPSVYYAMETWSNVTKKELEEIEKIQGEILKGLLELRSTTPYWGVLSETGLWPAKEVIRYKRLMLCHNIVNSTDKRLVKKIVCNQIEDPYPNCWGQIVSDDCKELNINLEDLWNLNKNDFKKSVKERIKIKIRSEFDDQKSMTKLRFVKNFGKKEYISDLHLKDCKVLMNLRLNMSEVKENYKGKSFDDNLCPCCFKGNDNTEHLLICTYINDPIVETNDLVNITNVYSMVKRTKRLLDIREKLGINIV